MCKDKSSVEEGRQGRWGERLVESSAKVICKMIYLMACNMTLGEVTLNDLEANVVAWLLTGFMAEFHHSMA